MAFHAKEIAEDETLVAVGSPGFRAKVYAEFVLEFAVPPELKACARYGPYKVLGVSPV